MSLKVRKRLKRLLKISVLITAVLVLSFVIIWFLFPFPKARLEKWSVSPLVLDVRGRPMLSIVGGDEQWRRPLPLENISPHLIQATIAVEDKRFYNHPGIDPSAVLRAAGQNIAAAGIVSGASTLDMQLCRMMDNRPRTFWAKSVESFRAIQLNQLNNKDEILELYLNTAPYGGNLRGVEAASLTYFDKHAKDLSLGEAALIAGLPKSPIRYQPDKYLQRAIKRRKVVLNSMFREAMITEQQLRQTRGNPIVIQKTWRTQRASHAAWMALGRRPTGGHTCIDLDIQDELERLVDENRTGLPEGSKLAVVIIDIAQSRIIAMVGSGDSSDPIDGQVNGALAKRSPGSALKPFIYAAAFEMGRLNRKSIVHDVPIQRSGWNPSNFDRTYLGKVTVAEALRRSLNVPAILVAEGIGLDRCCGVLEAAGVHLPANTQTRSGLALAVGGMEVTLLDLTNAYATLGRSGIREQPHLFTDEPRHQVRALEPKVCAAINDILSSRNRRPNGMEQFPPQDVPWFIWKTGTSSGRRDAWAVGHNGRYAIGVWVGRFRGTGRLAYTGSEAAEPLLARLFDLPALRTNDNPPAAAPIRIRHPLCLPAEVNQSLRIITPGNGDTFVSLSGKTVIHPSANRRDRITWFLNGKLVDNESVARLVLTPGDYELHCIDQTGQSSSVSFAVLPATAAY
ncbi:MAG: penicillin-binding protein 1C [Planctomycetota bacterium]|jgi:penicillin-binding protein 1C